MSIAIVLIDYSQPGASTGVSSSERQKCASALQIQAQRDVAKPPPFGYGISATVRAGTGPADVKTSEWVLGLFASPDIPDALGYHYMTEHGKPFMKIFPPLDKQDGVPWQTTASHEVLETLIDPNDARCAESWDGNIWAYEVGDAVEAYSYNIMVNGTAVPVSNFVLPPYFEPIQNLSGLKFDFMNQVTVPLQILPGGYGQYLSVDDNGWQVVENMEQRPRAFRLARHVQGGRGARRRQGWASRHGHRVHKPTAEGFKPQAAA
jgi:hypothetical protein